MGYETAISGVVVEVVRTHSAPLVRNAQTAIEVLREAGAVPEIQQFVVEVLRERGTLLPTAGGSVVFVVCS